MTKTKKIIITIVSILLVLGIAAWFFVPRILLALGTRAIVSELGDSADLGDSATYFTAFDVRSEDVQTIDNGHIAVEIPTDFQESSTHENCVIYRNSEETASIVLIGASDMSDLNLFAAESFGETVTGLQGTYSMERICKGFERMGNGLPDSAYNTYKCVYLLDEEDNSFWNFNQALAFMTAATLKQTAAVYGDVEIYESDEICGFVHVQEAEDGTASGLLEIYSVDDLGTVSSIMFKGVDRNTIYAVMNSAKSAK